MTVEIRMTGYLCDQIHQDLARPHPFAAERIGFAFGRTGSLANAGKLVLLTRYHSIPDEQYVEDENVGARIGREALTWAMQAVYHGRPAREGIFHVHVHPHKGKTNMSRIDRQEIPKLMPGFQSVGSEAAHGIIILSRDHGAGWVWLPSCREPAAARAISVIRKPLGIFEVGGRRMSKDRFSRQSFLGPDSEARIARCTVGVVGLGGGGSHIVQQLAHIGFQRFVIYDGDVVENSNLNRLVGATSVDVAAETSKSYVAKRMIFGLQRHAWVRGFAGRWQDNPEPLRECQIVFGCVDGYQGRHELEVSCRRYMMHYIDIGMDVHGENPPVIGGQVILSSPGGLCMRCMGFLTDEKMTEEAKRYGKAGARPQVVWANGVLASTAVGLAVDIVTGWTDRPLPHVYLSYDGSKGTVKESVTLRNLNLAACPHYSESDVGDPIPVEL